MEDFSILDSYGLGFDNLGDYGFTGETAVAVFGEDTLIAQIQAQYGADSDLYAAFVNAQEADADEEIELALQLLTNPTDDENFALNFEPRFIDREVSDDDEIANIIEVLAVIP